MPTTRGSHAAVLQLIAEGMRSPAAERLTPEQLRRMAGLLDKIAVELLVPGYEDETADDALLLPSPDSEVLPVFHG